MKKTDIALIIIIVSLSAGLAYWITSITIGQSNDEPIVVRQIEKIDVGEQKVDGGVFSKDAINPTVEATISGEDLTSFIDDDTTENDDSTAETSEQTSEE